MWAAQARSTIAGALALQQRLLLTSQIQFGRLFLPVALACDLTRQGIALEHQDKPHRSLLAEPVRM
jgi:hypothetical protein